MSVALVSVVTLLAITEIPLLVIQNPYPEIYRGCIAIRATKIIYANWVMFTIVDGGMVIHHAIYGFWLTRTSTT